jgi:Uma2 family endonuclease
MAGETQTAATLDDLRREQGKAELVGGRIVHLMPTGFRPGQIGGLIYISLHEHASATGYGVALPDNVGYTVPELVSGHESFSPDVGLFTGPLPADDMDFLEGPPALAVEVRSKGDYGPAAEVEIAAKRADYFEAGTLVVWDVDSRDRVVRCYRADAPDRPLEFKPGETADAEPAVPGWRLAIDSIFA